MRSSTSPDYLPNLHGTLDRDGNADSNRSGGKKISSWGKLFLVISVEKWLLMKQPKEGGSASDIMVFPQSPGLKHLKNQRTWYQGIVDFHRSRHTERFACCIHGKVVERVESFKFLGMQILADLTWTSPIRWERPNSDSTSSGS